MVIYEAKFFVDIIFLCNHANTTTPIISKLAGNIINY